MARMRLRGGHISVAQDLLYHLGRYAKAVEIWAKTPSKTMPAFPAIIERRSYDTLGKIFEIERLPFAFACKDKPVTSIPLPVLVQGCAQNWNDRNRIPPAFFGFGRPDMGPPHGAHDAQFCSRIVLPS